MVRATAAEYVKLNAGSYHAGWDATAVGNLCTMMDAFLDGKASPATLGTGTNEVAFANYCVWSFIEFQMKPVQDRTTNTGWWTTEHSDWLAALLTDTTYDGVTVIKMRE